MDPISTYSSYGAHGLLLLAVLWLTRVIVYQNKQLEAQREAYVQMIKEHIEILTKLEEHLDA